jgi:iron complex transport system ATP-binding protein
LDDIINERTLRVEASVAKESQGLGRGMVDASLRRLGLEDLSMRYIDEMSGGELQKVAIARALVQEPKLILLDEPTSSLDLKNKVDVLSIIRRVVNEHPVAVVMTMHDLNTAFRYADKCIFLKDGKIFYAGATQGVDAEIIETVYGLPVNIYRHNGCFMVIPQRQ